MSKGTIPAQPEGYADWLTQLKGDIAQARLRAAMAGELNTGSAVE